MSSSLSTKSSEPSVLCGVTIRLEGAASRFLPLTSFLAFAFAWLPDEPREAFTGLRGGVTGRGFVGGGIGGSCGLWIVLARLEGGGCRREEKRLCVAEAVTGGGGAIVPLRVSPLPDALGTIALFPWVAGLL